MTRFWGIRPIALTAQLLAAQLIEGSLGVVAAAESKPITIGGTLGLTGVFADPSADYKVVYDRWLADINRRGGLLGRPVKLVIYNDEGTPTVAQQLYNRLLDQDQVDLVLAPFSTFVGGAIVPLVLSHNKLLFNGGFAGINIFKNAKGAMIGTQTYQEPDFTRGVFELIKSLPAEKRPKRAAIFTVQNPFPLVVRDGLAGKGGALAFAKEAGIEVVVNEQYPPTATDFTALVQKAKAAGADLLLELGTPPDSLQMVRTVAQQGYKPALFCTCGSQVITLAAWPKLGNAAEGVFGTTVSWPSQGYDGLASLAESYHARGNETVPTYAIVGHAILQVIEQAVTGANSLDQDKLRQYIYSHDFHTAAGDIHFQDDGTPTFAALLLQYVHGSNQVVWPPKDQTAPPLVPMP
jgi:branched-chain amino acid transport system substrate-binding protein